MSRAKAATAALGRSLSSAAATHSSAPAPELSSFAARPAFAKKIKASRSVDLPTLHHEGKSGVQLMGILLLHTWPMP